MNIEAYKVGLQITLTDRVSHGVKLMSEQFKHAEKEAQALEKRLKAIEDIGKRGDALQKFGEAGKKMLEEYRKKAEECREALDKLAHHGGGEKHHQAHAEPSAHAGKARESHAEKHDDKSDIGKILKKLGAKAGAHLPEIVNSVLKHLPSSGADKKTGHAKGKHAAPKEKKSAHHRAADAHHSNKKSKVAKHLPSPAAVSHAANGGRHHVPSAGRSRGSAKPDDTKLFGPTGSKIFNILVKQAPALQKKLSSYAKAGGGDPSQAALNDATQVLQKKLKDLQKQLGHSGAMFDPAVKALDQVSKAINKVNGYAQKHPALTKFAFSVADMGTKSIDMVGKAMKASSELQKLGAKLEKSQGLVRMVGLAMSWAGRMIMVVLRALLTNPIGLVITAIAAAVYLLWKNWDSVKPKLEALWNWISSALGDFVGKFLNRWQSLFNFLIDGINKLLPKSMELQRMTFGDAYSKAHQNDKADSKPAQNEKPASKTIRTAHAAPAKVHKYDMYMDVHKVSSITSKHAARQMSRGTSYGSYDMNMSVPVTAQNR